MIARGFIGGLLVLLLAGCGGGDAAHTRAEQARLELEEKARRDTAAANQAITDLNKKMFGQKTPEPALAPSPKP